MCFVLVSTVQSMWCACFEESRDSADMHPARSLYRERLRSLGQSLRLVSSLA